MLDKAAIAHRSIIGSIDSFSLTWWIVIRCVKVALICATQLYSNVIEIETEMSTFTRESTTNGAVGGSNGEVAAHNDNGHAVDFAHQTRNGKIFTTRIATMKAFRFSSYHFPLCLL